MYGYISFDNQSCSDRWPIDRVSTPITAQMITEPVERPLVALVIIIFVK
jgi:hypothetical protein